MQKKALAALALSLVFFKAEAAPAGKFYLGPSLLVQEISADHSSARDLEPRLVGGYATMIDKTLYLAGEIFATPTTANLSNTKRRHDTSALASTNFGASLIPGTRIYREILGFGRLGLAYTKFHSPDEWKLGTQLGLGLQTGLTKYWVLRGDYIYTIFLGPVQGLGTPKSNELGLSLLYYFDKVCED